MQRGDDLNPHRLLQTNLFYNDFCYDSPPTEAKEFFESTYKDEINISQYDLSDKDMLACFPNISVEVPSKAVVARLGELVNDRSCGNTIGVKSEFSFESSRNNRSFKRCWNYIRVIVVLKPIVTLWPLVSDTRGLVRGQLANE